MFITHPEAFADLFNTKIPDAHRKITSNDVRLMTKGNLIYKYGFYGSQDLELVRGILQYEQLREYRPVPLTSEDEPEPPKCKKCEQPLPYWPRGKRGRPREYCSECESLRIRDRQRKFSDRQGKQRNKSLSTKTTSSLRQLHCEPIQ
ncbi:hypothetical protein ACFLUY_01175 [Chloroflexota bacterium]